MPLSIEPALGRPQAELVDTLNLAFADYVGGRLQLDESSLGAFLAQQGVDLGRSLAAVVDGSVRGLALVAARPRASRLATMAVRPADQGRGFGRALVERWLEEACRRGEERVELEVIGENEPAVRLYRGAGFRELGRLVSLECGPAGATPAATAPSGSLEPVEPARVAEAVAAHGAPDLPWQLSAPSLVALGPRAKGYRLGPAWALVVPPATGAVTLMALVVETPSRGHGHAARLLEALRALHPEAGMRVPALLPEALAGPFERRGFQRGRLWQRHMARTACGGAAPAR